MTRFTVTHAGLFGLTLAGLLFAAGCAKKPKAAESKTDEPAKTQPEANKPDSKKPKTPQVAANDHDPAKKTAEEPPPKKAAEKPEPKPRQPVVKAKPKQKSDDLVPIAKVENAAQALAHLKALNPAEIRLNSLDEVQKINFEGTDLTDEHLSLLKYFPYISHLNLTGTKITDAGLAHLKDHERLTELYLYSTPITDAGVKHLASLTRLEELCLDRTLITDKGVAHLKGLVELWRLHIQSRNKTTDAVFASLKDMKRLRQLWIHGSGFSADRVKQFRQEFPRCEVKWDPADPKKDEPDKPRKKGEVP